MVLSENRSGEHTAFELDFSRSPNLFIIKPKDILISIFAILLFYYHSLVEIYIVYRGGFLIKK